MPKLIRLWRSHVHEVVWMISVAFAEDALEGRVVWDCIPFGYLFERFRLNGVLPGVSAHEPQALDLLLKIEDVDVNIKDGVNMTPVMYAAATCQNEALNTVCSLEI